MGAVFSGAERTRFLTVQRLEPARYRPHVILGTSGDTLAAFRAAAVSCEVPRSPEGVALPHPISDDARAEVRRSLALSDDRVIVTLTGQVAEVKGIWEFLDAAHALVAKGIAATSQSSAMS